MQVWVGAGVSGCGWVRVRVRVWVGAGGCGCGCDWVRVGEIAERGWFGIWLMEGGSRRGTWDTPAGICRHWTSIAAADRRRTPNPPASRSSVTFQRSPFDHDSWGAFERSHAPVVVQRWGQRGQGQMRGHPPKIRLLLKRSQYGTPCVEQEAFQSRIGSRQPRAQRKQRELGLSPAGAQKRATRAPHAGTHDSPRALLLPMTRSDWPYSTLNFSQNLTCTRPASERRSNAPPALDPMAGTMETGVPAVAAVVTGAPAAGTAAAAGAAAGVTGLATGLLWVAGAGAEAEAGAGVGVLAAGSGVVLAGFEAVWGGGLVCEGAGRALGGSLGTGWRNQAWCFCHCAKMWSCASSLRQQALCCRVVRSIGRQAALSPKLKLQWKALHTCAAHLTVLAVCGPHPTSTPARKPLYAAVTSQQPTHRTRRHRSSGWHAPWPWCWPHDYSQRRPCEAASRGSFC